MINNSLKILMATCIVMMVVSASAMAGQTIYLIRHAEKLQDESADPALTSIGEKRAVSFAEYFSGKGLKAVYSSDTLRTRSTAAPTAQAYELPVTLYDPRNLKEIAAIAQERGDTLLIVGHSNTTAKLANILTDGEMADLQDHHYDRIYIISLKDDKTSSVRIEHIKPFTP